MQVFFIISLLLFTISFGAKSIIHVILDNRNGYQINYGSSRGFVYFLPYGKEVTVQDEKLKKVCNYLHRVSIFFLATFIIAFSIRYIVKQ